MRNASRRVAAAVLAALLLMLPAAGALAAPPQDGGDWGTTVSSLLDRALEWMSGSLDALLGASTDTGSTSVDTDPLAGFGDTVNTLTGGETPPDEGDGDSVGTFDPNG